MFEVKGSVSTAKVFTDYVEPTALSQIIELCNQEFTEGSKIRIMPDVHAGAGCVIGTTMTIENKKIVPNLVGVDIGCGLTSARYGGYELGFLQEYEKEEGVWVNDFLKEFDRLIRANVPMGTNVCEKLMYHPFRTRIKELICAKNVNIERGYHSIGTLGGGNHFIEVGCDIFSENKGPIGELRRDFYITVHSGSRGIGKEVATYYQKIAEEQCNGVPKHLAYLSGQAFEDYIHDMQIMQEYASINRDCIIEKVTMDCALIAPSPDSYEETIHNYVEIGEKIILRKGAISAKKDEKVMIPLNMRDGIIIGKGKGLEDWNESAPHGAGRVLSRGQAKRQLSVDIFKDQMEGIYSTCINESTLDESPSAYKSSDEICNHLDSVEIVGRTKPIYNIKA